jgi:hypothetical protein
MGTSVSDSTLGLNEPGCIQFTSSSSFYMAYYTYEFMQNMLQPTTGEIYNSGTVVKQED